MKAAIRPHHGSPALFVNGKPELFAGYCSYFPLPKFYRDYSAGGGNSFLVTVSLSGRWVRCSAENETAVYGVPIWQGYSTYDYSTVDARIAEILRENPQARIIVRPYLDSPRWWDKLHPEELARQFDGTILRASIGSELWRSETAVALTALLRHLENGPHREAVIGYFLTGQGTEEWYYPDFRGDYSPTMTRCFREWLQVRYGVAEDFSRVKLPSPEEFNGKGEKLFFRSEKERRLTDYSRFVSEKMAETILYFAHVAKQERPNLLCGVFYGYVAMAPQTMGTHGINRLLDSPDLDFISAPNTYIEARRLGTPWPSQGIPDAVKAAGKLWLNESDIRTHLTRNFYQIPGFCAENHPAYGKGVPVFDGYPSPEQGVTALRKCFGWALTQHLDWYWFDLVRGYYDDPVYQQEFARFHAIAAKAFELDRRSAAEVVMLIDPWDSALTSPAGEEFMNNLVFHQILRLSIAGAPFDLLRIDDLEKTDFSQYKLVLFAGMFRLDSRRRRLIDAKLKNAGRHLVWIYAPGIFSDDERTEEEHLHELTGIKLQVKYRETTLRTTWYRRDSELTTFLPGNLEFGAMLPTGPVVSAADPAAQVYGHLCNGQPGWTQKNCGNFTSIHFAAPDVPPEILRRLYDDAGVRVCNRRNDLCYADRNFLTVMANEAGPRRLLPTHSTSGVRELFTGRDIPCENGEFLDEFAAGEVKIYQFNIES